MAATYPIVGIKAGAGPNGQVPVRRDIDEWWQSNNVVDVNEKSLLIQAMTIFQSIDVNDKLSYFQIAGVHGQPLIPWDENTQSVTEGAGYCTHDSILFPSWHRPYLLLVEQRLYEVMINQVIPTFAPDDQADLKQAADQWRLPYWDWATAKPDWSNPQGPKGLNVPLLLTLQNVEIRTPNGSSQVRNPFWDFQMPKHENMGQHGITEVNEEPFQDCVATSKHPPTDDPADPQYTADWVNGDVQDNAAVAQSLTSESGFGALPEAVYRLFTENYFQTYDAFASTRYSPIPPKFNPGQNIPHYLSLEGIHNNIHGDTGGLGHMAIVPVAAFDPIFWLHHCNVDRLYAIWQSLYPDKWFSPDPNLDAQRQDTGTWSNQAGTLDTPTTALTPFHRDSNGTYWTSDDQRDFTKLGFSYTELQPWLPKYQVSGKFDQATYVKDIKAQIDKLYSSTGKMALAPSDATPIAAQVKLAASPPTGALGNSQAPRQSQAQAPLQTAPQATKPLTTIHSHTHTHTPPSKDAKTQCADFVINVLYEKFALNGLPFTVHLHLGSHQIGTVYNFSAPPHTLGRDHTGCVNCQRQISERAKSTGQVILTNALLACERNHHHSGLQLSSLSRDDVVPFLRENLKWSVTRREREVPLADLPSLKVSVAMGEGEHHAEDGVLSRYGGYEVLWDVTAGREGGAAEGDDV